jgi:hypothetical protein
MLIRHFSELDKNFVDKLIERANVLNLANYINLTLRYTRLILETPVIIKLKKLESNNLESRSTTAFWDFCYRNIFRPHHSSTNDSKMKIAKLILYWRGHLLKMPLHILIPHLATKSYMQLRDIFIKEKSAKEII